MPTSHPKILVHVHVYYQNMWPELATKLKSIEGCDIDLQITIAQDDQQFRSDVLKQYPHATITLVENRGFDVLPFVQLIQNKDMDCYDYVIKIHTKRDTLRCKLGGHILQGPDWRNASLSFLDNPAAFSNCIRHFENHQRCGLIASHLLTIKIAKKTSKITKRRLSQLIQDYKQRPISKAKFVAGTMFIARANALKSLYHIPLDAFENRIEHDDLFAHAVERFMGHMIYEQGLTIQDPNEESPDDLGEALQLAWKKKIWPTVFSAGLTNKNRLFIKLFKIPLPYCLNEALFPSYQKKLAKERQTLIDAVNRVNQAPTENKS